VDARDLRYLEAMGIDVYEPRSAAPAPVAAALVTAAPRAVTAATAIQPATARTAPPSLEAGDAVLDALGWEELAARVAGCTQCGLAATRTQTVFGVGNRAAEWLVIGEAPGADEDRQGEPFVGRAGQLLTSMLRAMGLPRPQVYIANILKCRPPGNRDPSPTEVGCCIPYLRRQIALLAPRVILCVGRIAAQNLLDTETPIGKLRGKVHHFGASRIPVVVTYHPAYLLRSPGEKRKAWTDLRLALEVFARGHG
jgi:DNA polymerase